MTRRFWASYLLALVGFTSLISGLSAYGYLADQARVGASALLLVSLLRSSVPMAAGSALLLALALWADALPAVGFAQELDRGLKRALVLAAPGYALSALIGVGVCFVVAAALAGQSGAGFAGWLTQATRLDLGMGLSFTLLDTLLLLLLARRYAPRLRAMPASLPAKLIVIVTVTVPLRATLALFLAPFMPG
jgi:hypothetical protein